MTLQISRRKTVYAPSSPDPSGLGLVLFCSCSLSALPAFLRPPAVVALWALPAAVVPDASLLASLPQQHRWFSQHRWFIRHSGFTSTGGTTSTGGALLAAGSSSIHGESALRSGAVQILSQDSFEEAGGTITSLLKNDLPSVKLGLQVPEEHIEQLFLARMAEL